VSEPTTDCGNRIKSTGRVFLHLERQGSSETYHFSMLTRLVKKADTEKEKRDEEKISSIAAT
jgi:hypothetical protein